MKLFQFQLMAVACSTIQCLEYHHHHHWNF